MIIKTIDFGGKMPTRKHYNDAGADCYANITVKLEPHETAKIPLGFGINLPDGFMALVMPRSSMSANGIVTHVAPIDSGYKGEIHAITENNSNETVVISKGDRVGQLVVMPIILPTYIDENTNLDERGCGAFGSTGR